MFIVSGCEYHPAEMALEKCPTKQPTDDGRDKNDQPCGGQRCERAEIGKQDQQENVEHGHHETDDRLDSSESLAAPVLLFMLSRLSTYGDAGLPRSRLCEMLIIGKLSAERCRRAPDERKDAAMTDQNAGIESVRKLENVRQIREYTSEPVADDVLHELLEVARWSGSSQNTQSWHFIVVTDKDALATIGKQRPNIGWVGDVPLAIAIVLNGGDEINEAHDLGRVTERLLIAAKFLGIGAGTAWVGDPPQQAVVKQLLGVPEERTLRSVVAVGHPQPGATHKLGRKTSGRKPLDELVSYGTFGQSRP